MKLFNCEFCKKEFKYLGNKTKCINEDEVFNDKTETIEWKFICDKCYEIEHTKAICKIMNLNYCGVKV